MIDSKSIIFKNVLDSAKGLHLTMYIKFDGDVLGFRKRLNKLLKTPKMHLKSVLDEDQIKKFLEPIEALGQDGAALKQMRGNIGIFRKNDFFRFIVLPIEIEEMSLVADTFHIKPLLKWAQSDQEFLLVGLRHDGAFLYKGSQSEFKKIDEAVYPDYLMRHDEDGGYASFKEKQKNRFTFQQTMEWLGLWVEDLTKNTKTTIFVAGTSELVRSFIQNFKSERLYPETIAAHFSESHVFEIMKNIKGILRLDSQKSFTEALEEFELAKNLGFTKTNIFQIAKAALKGNVRKLIVAEDFNVFGKLDKASGGLAIHPTDMDHEDDCLLDDLAQAVLLKGGEVVVAKKNEIPGGKLIMAILNKDQVDLYSMDYQELEVAI